MKEKKLQGARKGLLLHQEEDLEVEGAVADQAVVEGEQEAKEAEEVVVEVEEVEEAEEEVVRQMSNLHHGILCRYNNAPFSVFSKYYYTMIPSH